MRRATGITLQPHQILRLPRKIAFQNLGEICRKQLKHPPWNSMRGWPPAFCTTKRFFLYGMGCLLKIRGSLFYKIHGLHVKKKHLSLQNGGGQRQKIMFKVGWPPTFCREKPSTKRWWPTSSIRILFGSGSFHIFFGSKKNKNPFARVPRTKPSIDSHEALVHLIRRSAFFFGTHSRAQVSHIALLCSSCDPPYI